MQAQSTDIASTVRSNNNIAWRNVDSVLPKTGTTLLRPYFIGNPRPTWTLNTITFDAMGPSFQSFGGRIIVDLSPALYERWRRGNPTGGPGLGTRFSQVGPTQLMITSDRARLDVVMLNPRERLGMTLRFTANVPTPQVVVFNVVQRLDSAFGPDIGGVQYRIRMSQS